MRVDIQYRVQARGLPDEALLATAANAALEDAPDAAICVRIVDEAEGRALNRQWRGKDQATNVLAFSSQAPPGLPADAAPALMGDIVLCAPVIFREAAEQDKPTADHWMHLVVHGVLHLRGFDHIQQPAAATMEAAERRILERLGVPDPYRPSSVA